VVELIPIQIRKNDHEIQLNNPYRMIESGIIIKNDGLTVDQFESWFEQTPKSSYSIYGTLIAWQPTNY
jgi:hypothetical protein